MSDIPKEDAVDALKIDGNESVETAKIAEIVTLLNQIAELSSDVPAAKADVQSKIGSLLGPDVQISDGEGKLLELKKLAVHAAVDEVQGIAQDLAMLDEIDAPTTDEGRALHARLDSINAAMKAIPEFTTGFKKE